MKRVLVCVLVACGPPPRPAPIENVPPADPTRERACASDRLTGVILVGDRDNEPAIGATIVGTSAKNTGERVVISDEHGKFELDRLDTAHDKLTLYYENRMFQGAMPDRCGAVTIEIDILPKLADPDSPQPMRFKYGR